MDFICCFESKSLPGACIVRAGTTPDISLTLLNEEAASINIEYTLVHAVKDEQAERKARQINEMTRQCTFLNESILMSSHTMKLFMSLCTDGRTQELHKTEKHDISAAVVYYWELKRALSENQPVRHRIGTHHTLVGEYKNERINYFGSEHRSLRDFAKYHYRNFSPYSTENDHLNGWNECECEVNQKWQFMNELFEPVKQKGLLQGQKVRHIIGESIRTGTIQDSGVILNGKTYSSLQHFAVCHQYSRRSDRTGKQEVGTLEAEIEGEWYPILFN